MEEEELRRELWGAARQLMEWRAQGEEVIAGIKRVILYGNLKGSFALDLATNGELRFAFAGTPMYCRYLQNYRRCFVELGTWREGSRGQGKDAAAIMYKPFKDWSIGGSETIDVYEGDLADSFYQAVLEVLRTDDDAHP